MNFTVSWTRRALREFLALWTSATDPDAVDAAALQIDQMLATDADQQGEDRVPPFRILLVPPRAAIFVADIDVTVAYVVTVGWSGAPG